MVKREQLETAPDYCRDGNVLIVTKLDRLARSMADLVAMTSRLKGRAFPSKAGEAARGCC